MFDVPEDITQMSTDFVINQEDSLVGCEGSSETQLQRFGGLFLWVSLKMSLPFGSVSLLPVGLGPPLTGPDSLVAREAGSHRKTAAPFKPHGSGEPFSTKGKVLFPGGWCSPGNACSH